MKQPAPAASSVIRILTACGILAGMALSAPLWFAGNDRLYPFVPLSAAGAAIPTDLVPILSGLCVLAAGALLFPRRLGVAVPILLGSCCALFFHDQSRLQPWMYQYLWFSIALYICRRQPSDPGLISAVQIMLAAIYFWAGLSKCSASYFLHVFPAVFEPVVDALNAYPVFALALAALGPLLEIWIGLSFLLLKHTRIASLAAVSLHALILLMLGPLGSHYNSVVWPWNLCMPVLAVTVFWNTRASKRPIPALLEARPVFAASVLLAFFVLPTVSKAGLWDHYLSFSLYSGRTPEGVITIRNADREKLPDIFLSSGTWKETQFELAVNDWSYAALNVPAYPERRVFRQVFSYVCETFGDSGKISFTYARPRRPWSAERQFSTWHCTQP